MTTGHPYHAKRLEAVGKLVDPVPQLAVGAYLLLSFFREPDHRHLVAPPGIGVAVQGVYRDIGLAAHEPAVIGKIYFPDLLPRLEPNEFIGDLPPKALRIADGIGVDRFVIFNKGLFLHSARRGILFTYFQEMFNLGFVAVRHLETSRQ